MKPYADISDLKARSEKKPNFQDSGYFWNGAQI